MEIYAVWLGIYAVSVCHFLGRGFQDGHVSYAFFMRRKSPPHLWNWENLIPLKTSQFAGAIHPKSKNFRLIKKAPFKGWPLQKLIFHQTRMCLFQSKIISGFLPGILASLLPSGTRIRHWKFPGIPYVLTNDVPLQFPPISPMKRGGLYRKGKTWKKTSAFYEAQRCEATVVDGFSRLVAINGNELQRLPHIHILSRGVLQVQTWGKWRFLVPIEMATYDLTWFDITIHNLCIKTGMVNQIPSILYRWRTMKCPTLPHSPACKQLMGYLMRR